jgi:hypothetical protein
MLAMLAAVTDIIKQNKGTESSTEYYAALVSHNINTLVSFIQILTYYYNNLFFLLR